MPEHLREALRFRAHLGAGDERQADGAPAVAVDHGDLERVGGRRAAGAADRDPVPPLVDHLEAAEIRAHVRGQVARGIADLVEELLGHGGARDPAARARVLGHDEAAVGRHLGDRIADVERRHLPPVGQVAARRLRPALEHVPGDRPRGEPVPVVPRPAELVHERPEREGGVGRAAGHHDLGAGAERLGDRPGAEVRVGGDDAVADAGERPPVVQVRERHAGGDELVEPRQEVVARYHAERGREPLGAAGLGDAVAAGLHVHSARIGHHPDAPLHDLREHRAEHGDEVVGVAEARVAGALALEDDHGDLGQEVEGDVVERPAPDLRGERARVVPPVAARVGDAQRLAHACGFYAAASPPRKASRRSPEAPPGTRQRAHLHDAAHLRGRHPPRRRADGGRAGISLAVG